MSDFGEWKRVKTRKPHKCAGCFDEIATGTNVQHWSGEFDGHFSNLYLCDPCNAILSEFDPQDTWAEGDLGDLRREREREMAQQGA